MITGGLEEERMLTYIEYFEDYYFRLLPQLGKSVRYSKVSNTNGPCRKIPYTKILKILIICLVVRVMKFEVLLP